MPGPVPTPLASWMSNPPAGTHPAVSGGPLLGSPPIPGSTLTFSVMRIQVF